MAVSKQLNLIVQAQVKGQQAVLSLSTNLKNLQNLANNNATAFDKTTNSVSKMASNGSAMVQGFNNSLRNLAVSIGSVYTLFESGKAMIKTVDQLNSMTAKLNLINDGQMTTAQLNEKIFQTAQKCRAEYEDVGNMVAKLGLLAGDAFSSNQQMLDFAEQINKQLVVTGATGQQASAVMLQLTQALGSGRLQGDELRSIMENMPTIIQQIANELGVTKGQVKELASEGKITSDVLVNAVLNGSRTINQQFEQMPLTFGQAMTRIKNQIIYSMSNYSYIFGNILTSNLTQGVFQAFAHIGDLISGVFLGFISTFVAVGNMIYTVFSPFIDFINDGLENLGLATNKTQTWADAMASLGAVIGVLISLWLMYKGVMMIVSIVQTIFTALASGGISMVTASVMLLIGALLLVPFFIGLMTGDWRLGIAYMVATVVAFGEVLKQVWFMIADTTANVILAIVYALTMAVAFIVGNVMDGAMNIADIVNACCQVVQNYFGGLGLIINGIWEQIVGAVQNAFGGMLQKLGKGFENFINDCIGGVNSLIKQLNKIPGVDIGTMGKVSFTNANKWGNDNIATGKNLVSKGQAMLNKPIDMQAVSKGKDISQTLYKNINNSFDKLWQKNMDWSQVGNKFNSTVKDVMKWFDKPKGNGQDQGLGGNKPLEPGGDNGGGGKGSKVPKPPKLPKPTTPKPSKMPQLDKIASDTGTIKDSVATGEEDLKYLLDIAKQEAINRFTSSNITVNMNNNNNISNDMDIDTVVGKLDDKLREQLLTSAEGVHY